MLYKTKKCKLKLKTQLSLIMIYPEIKTKLYFFDDLDTISVILRTKYFGKLTLKYISACSYALMAHIISSFP